MKILYPGFKAKCVTFSFDDGEIQDRQLAEMLRRYNLKATFNIITKDLGKSGPLIRDGKEAMYHRISKDEITEVYKGFEVAAHGMTHADFTNLDLNGLRNEIFGCIDTLKMYAENKIIGLAYPGGRYNKNTVRDLEMLHICYARTTRKTYSFNLPEQFLEWHPTCHYSFEGIFQLIEQFKKEQPDQLRLFYIFGHSFELDKKGSFSWEHMERVCAELSGQHDIWYASNMEIYSYITAARKLQRTIDFIYNPSDIVLYIEAAGQNIIVERGGKLPAGTFV